jgi:hypothetical protein
MPSLSSPAPAGDPVNSPVMRREVAACWMPPLSRAWRYRARAFGRRSALRWSTDIVGWTGNVREVQTKRTWRDVRSEAAFREVKLKSDLRAVTSETLHKPGSHRTYSITSSARARSVGDISRPSVLAVLRLITSSNLVDWTTGRSAGLAPLRILPT